MLTRYRHLGIQQRIMLYVAVGLVVMFGSFAFVGLQSIQQATDLVYEERLSTAYTIISILRMDFSHVARDAQEASAGLAAADAQRQAIAAGDLLDHLSKTDPFRFFQVTGLWILDADGRFLGAAGTPVPGPDSEAAPIGAAMAKLPAGELAVLPAVGGSTAGVPFVTIATRVGDTAGSAGRIVALHTVSANSSAPYDPTSERLLGEAGPPRARPENPRVAYHLEVISPTGLAVLGIGEDEHPGAPSHHFPAIQSVMAVGEATTFLHEPMPGETFEPHVMAVAPLTSSGFYLLLEQPADVALALPIQLRQRLVLLTTLGFLTTLLVAWVTTQHVVRPTRQLTAAAQRMAQGDLESPITVSAQDEVGNLAESLDTMRQKLRAAYEQLEGTNRELEVQVKERTDRLAEVLRKIISAQEEERYRLARELHDETAQTLGALLIALDRARDGLPATVLESPEQIAEARSIAARLLEGTRRLILDLRPMVLDDLGLAPAIRWYAETHLEEQGVATIIEVEQPSTRLTKYIEVSLFRMVQEAVNNIAKHACARHAKIRLVFRDSVASVVVTDDGKGFNVGRALGAEFPVRSVGLLGVQERVWLLNGHIAVCSEEGKGTTVSIQIPIAEERA